MVTDDELLHYGVLRRSGRYPWGSGETQTERSRGFLGYVDGLRKEGLSETMIAQGMGITTTQLRAARTIAKTEVRQADAALAFRLKEKGMSNVAIGERMGINESSVRALLDPAMAQRRDVLQTTADMLKEKISDGGYLDIGSGTENHMGISADKLSKSVALLREEGYEVHNVQVSQLGTGNKTTIKVLAPPGTKYVDIVKNPENIKAVAAYTQDGGSSYFKIKPPRDIELSRVGVRYAEQGGADADGVIYVRRGVEDISLGGAKYAQVRIAVGGSHYLKGMAMYSDKMPEGVDLLFNTNKSDTGNPLDAMKKQKDDPENRFGSAIKRQRMYTDADGKMQQSVLNIVNEEGDWGEWSRTLSSQMLSKQPVSLAKKQLDLALKSRQDEFAEIQALTNPVVRKKLLESFADGADSASVHLKAAALPRQGTHVLLPIDKMKPTEIYAPNYRPGERVVLIRFPHGGTFEIPELVVNNKNPDAKRTIGNAVDAVGIHPSVAERLSGADFDGDTVLVIPNNDRAVQTSAPLSGLKGFDPKAAYPKYDGMKPMSAKQKQQEMGNVSNLITDMTIRGAKPDEIARAVRHSMVVIDAEKHELNYKQSEIDNGIASLKEKYQGRGATGRLAGASTIVSRASSEYRVPKRKPRSAAEGGPIDPVTGRKVYEETADSYVDRRGKTVVPTVKSTKLAETDDAHTLSSGTVIETVYADHSNNLKALANKARLEILGTKNINYSPTAKQTYSLEVETLNSKLNTALRNKPLERTAQSIANAIVSEKTQDKPGLETSELKKVKGQALTVARERVGAKEQQIGLSPQEWAGIQGGAISTNKLRQIL